MLPRTHHRRPRPAALLATLLAVLLAWLAAATGARAQAAGTASMVVVLEVSDAISPASADCVLRGLRRAQEAGAGLVVLQLDTSGGLDLAMRQVIQASSPPRCRRSVRTAAGERSLRTRTAELLHLLPDWRSRLLSVIANPSMARS